MSTDITTSKRGFAALTKERRVEIARMGGKAVPNSSRSFSQDVELAIAAGRKGGVNSHKNR